MAGITQTIPQYSAGISEQPDHLKFPGQVTDVVNAIPDVTKGLFKRPGSKRIEPMLYLVYRVVVRGSITFVTRQRDLI